MVLSVRSLKTVLGSFHNTTGICVCVRVVFVVVIVFGFWGGEIFSVNLSIHSYLAVFL